MRTHCGRSINQSVHTTYKKKKKHCVHYHTVLGTKPHPSVWLATVKTEIKNGLSHHDQKTNITKNLPRTNTLPSTTPLPAKKKRGTLMELLCTYSKTKITNNSKQTAQQPTLYFCTGPRCEDDYNNNSHRSLTRYKARHRLNKTREERVRYNNADINHN